MILNIYIEDQHYPLDVAEALVNEGEDFFAKIDADMAKGWQMSREWVDSPNVTQRCQIVADKLMAALQVDNPQLVSMLAAYILARLPGVKGVRIDINGEMQEIEFVMGGGAA
ncbi:MAG: hypothetical protein OQK94_00765 [Gammaproteobacteria bacterium]|nr:hypothetical protein [Gammaproteobacteria bacterium]MCW8958995.1 hypothetical protein [Gammaproteobacteria bacterium]MCW8972245.1 hypothetical protein [Gammaproteobacteria bacterium]MCW8993865.1 hypothetical protein [Gammaproteobacteria bacterium]MCW9089510.1 hypothetical protein [Gammaproteobacteria bacterium]